MKRHIFSLEGVRKKNCLGYYKNPKYSKEIRRRDFSAQRDSTRAQKSKHKRKRNDDDFYDDVTQRIISEGIVFIELLQKRRARLESFNGEKTQCIVID